MNPVNRRELCIALSSLAALAAVPAEAQTNEPGQKPEMMAPGVSSSDKVLKDQHAIRFEDLPVKKNANGESRAVMQGVLPTGESVEMHETSLLPGHMPHPAHKHRHSEIMCIREGTLEFQNDGKPERVGPGGVIFAASNVMHGLKNIGDTTAQYFVIAIGREDA
jgi:quercetin dioxygenase-like cupin family protein